MGGRRRGWMVGGEMNGGVSGQVNRGKSYCHIKCPFRNLKGHLITSNQLNGICIGL